MALSYTYGLRDSIATGRSPMPRKQLHALPAQLPAAQTAEPLEQRWARIASELVICDLDDEERAFLATCQRIHRRNAGCNSPFEEFFASLVEWVEAGHWPTPDNVEQRLKEFRDNFDSMTCDATQFMEAYPQLAVQAENLSGEKS